MDSTEQDSDQPGSGSAAIAAVGYLPLLFLVPLLGAREDEFARFHGRQGLALFLVFVGAWLAIWVVDLLFGRVLGHVILLGFLFRMVAWLVHNVVGTLLSLAYIAAMLVGVVQAAQGRWWRLPFVGAYAERFGL